MFIIEKIKSENNLTNLVGSGIMGVGGEKMQTGSFEWVKSLDEKQKIKFLGGKTKAALFDAGLLSREDYIKPIV